MQDWKRSEPCDNGSDEEQDDDDDYDRILIKCLSAHLHVSYLFACTCPVAPNTKYLLGKKIRHVCCVFIIIDFLIN